jgi:hypothetical protein
MANSKISALTSATTPLAGTETLPVVQSSATTKVTVANLTAGRAVATGALTVTGAVTATGNITAGLNAGAGTARIDIGNASGNGIARLNFLGVNVNYCNWSVGSNDITNNSLTFTPSTAFGGTTFTTPAISLSYLGNLTFNTGNLVQGTAAKGINFTANTPAAGMTSQLLNWYEEGSWTPTGNGVTFASVTGYYIRIGSQVTVVLDATWPVTANTNAANINSLPFAVNHGGAAAIGYTNSSLDLLYNAGSSGSALNVYLNAGTSPTNAQLSGKRVILSCVYILN